MKNALKLVGVTLLLILIYFNFTSTPISSDKILNPRVQKGPNGLAQLKYDAILQKFTDLDHIAVWRESGVVKIRVYTSRWAFERWLSSRWLFFRDYACLPQDLPKSVNITDQFFYSYPDTPDVEIPRI